MRLIDIDELIIKGWSISKVTRIRNSHQEIEYLGFDDIPTAFNVDKVVQELEMLKEDARDYWNDFAVPRAAGALDAYLHAIEIVKAGGVK